jgi:hypothetical protein
MPEERILRVRVPEELYWALVRKAGSPKKLSATVTELLKGALNLQATEPSSHQTVEPSSHQATKPSSQIHSTRPQSTAIDQPKREPRPASQAQIDTIMEIAWEIATLEDVTPILEHKLEFKIPDDLSELTSQQASQIIQTLKDLKKPLSNEQVKEAKELLEKLAQKQNLKPEDLASKLNIPTSTNQLRLYHLELLKQLAMQDPSLIPPTQNKEGETK